MVMIKIDQEKCNGCNYCRLMCAQEAFSYQNYVIEVDQEKCASCGACAYYCPSDAILITDSD